MQKMCVEPPTTVEMLDALEAGIAALRERYWHAGALEAKGPASTPVGKRTHPFSRIEEL
jgi:hypothetical protein